MSSIDRIEHFIGKYPPDIASGLTAARARMRSRVLRGYEWVYDNYNALVFAYGPVGHAREAVLSLAAYPRWVTLFLLQGADLEDPHAVLRGNGGSVRSVRLVRPGQLDEPALAALIEAALAPHSAAFAAAPPLRTVIESVSARQRPRRPS